MSPENHNADRSRDRRKTADRSLTKLTPDAPRTAESAIVSRPPLSNRPRVMPSLRLL